MHSNILVSLLIVGVLWFPKEAVGQIKTSVSFSNPWITKAKQANEDRKEYKKHVNDSLKNFKKLEKYYKHRLDSIARSISKKADEYIPVSLTDMALLVKFKKRQKAYLNEKDSLILMLDSQDKEIVKVEKHYDEKYDSIQSEIDIISSKYGGGRLQQFQNSNASKPDSLLDQQYQFYANQYLSGKPDSIPMDISIDSLKYYTTTRDSLLFGQLTEYLEDYAYSLAGVDELQMKQQRMLAEQDRLDDYKADFNRYRDKKNLKSNLQKISKSELLSKNETLNSAHKNLSSYKRKYLTLPSSKHLEGGTKRTSLEGESFWERIKVGGNLRVSQREFLEIDFSPSIAYLVNKKWAIGTEFVFRGEFGNGRRWYRSFDSDTYGGRIFTDYSVYKSFFVHAEFENLYTIRKPIGSEVASTTISVPGAMAGLGKTFGLGKNVTGKILIQYNFIHDETKALYASPWVVRFGFDLKKLKKVQE